MTVETRDPRDPELIRTHSAMARLAFDEEVTRIQEIAASDPNLNAVDLASPNTATEYTVAVDFEAGIFVHLGISFSRDGFTHLEYSGFGGGNIVGVGVLLGTAWLNYDPNTIRHWEANFYANMFPGMVNVNLWGLSGEYIGSLVAGGFNLNISAAGGRGSFS